MEPRASARGRTFETTTRVRYAETDATGIAYYASYLVYFELGRVEMFRELGLPYDRHLPIAESYCRYRGSAVFDDLLLIRTTVDAVRSRGFRLGCTVHRSVPGAQAELLAEGYTSMVTADDDGRPIPLPLAFREAFGEPDAPASRPPGHRAP